MSHYAVLVIGDKVDDQLAPFKEQLEVEFKDLTDEYREEYETETRTEWYCDSHSSWGFQLSKENFDRLTGPVGRIINMDVEKRGGFGSYFKLGGKYRGYYPVEEDGRQVRSEETVYFEVEEIVETTHPDPTTCFEGKVKLRIIEAPKEIPLKDAYESFEQFCEDWHGAEPNEDGRYGYWNNPNAKWDWFQIGGRYRDRLKLKAGATGDKGEGMAEYVGSLYRESKDGWCDSALKKDIDFAAMHGNEKDYAEASRFWEMHIEGQEPQNDEDKRILEWYGTFYKSKYYTDRYKTKETFAQCMSNFTMWAILKDGKWAGKGEMGWFGLSDESNDEAVTWELNFYDTFIKDLPDNTLITVVDCHI